MRTITGSHAVLTGLIGLEIYATAQARAAVLPPAQIVRPVYYAPPRAAAWSQPARGVPSNAVRQRLVFVNPTVSIAVPSVDVPLTLISADDFHGNPIGGSTSFGVGSTVPEGTNGTFRADQVEKQVSLIPGSGAPTYPEVLRIAGRKVETPFCSLYPDD